MSEVSDFIKGMSVADREKLAHKVGLTGQYLTTLAHRKMGHGEKVKSVSLHLAIELDKSSDGRISFVDILKNTERVDWKYIVKNLSKRLNKRNKI
tara:strand:+ start:400 stop:684 length:285 start_codon:yes stop_codon:yes gene_type:complete